MDTFNFRAEFEKLVRGFGVPDKARVCENAEAEQIISQAKEKYVNGHPYSWWYSLKVKPSKVIEYTDGNAIYHLREHAPPTASRCWLILETEERVPPIADIEIDLLFDVLSELPYIEYYVVDQEFNWIMIENDHEQLIICESNS